jgi:hypothetical protein
MVREGCWKYVCSGGLGSGLYNLAEDHYEWNNLSGRKEFFSVEFSLKKKLLEWHVESSGLFTGLRTRVSGRIGSVFMMKAG